MVSCAGSNLDTVIEFIEASCTGKTTSSRDLMSTQIKKLGSYSGYTPLHFAVEFGSSVEIVKLLLRYGADCCATTCHELTPHAIAIMKSHDEISRVLQEHCSIKTKV